MATVRGRALLGGIVLEPSVRRGPLHFFPDDLSVVVVEVVCRCPAFLFPALGCVACVCIGYLDVSVGALFIKRGETLFR